MIKVLSGRCRDVSTGCVGVAGVLGGARAFAVPIMAGNDEQKDLSLSSWDAMMKVFVLFDIEKACLGNIVLTYKIALEVPGYLHTTYSRTSQVYARNILSIVHTFGKG